MFVTVWSYGKWYVSIVPNTIPLVDHSVVKVWILAMPYKLIPNFVEIFSGLEGQLVYVTIYDSS